MPDIASKEYRVVDQKDLADMLDRSSAAISQSVRRTHFCAGYPLFEWAKWHPGGKQVMHYEVPVAVLKELLPEEEHTRFGIFK
jgi:hypothetical protein